MIRAIKYKDAFEISDWYWARATKLSLMTSGKTRLMALRNLRDHMRDEFKKVKGNI